MNNQMEFGWFCPFKSVVRTFRRFLASGKFNESITLEQWHAWHAALNHGRASAFEVDLESGVMQ